MIAVHPTPVVYGATIAVIVAQRLQQRSQRTHNSCR